ncbi:hypothetical protein GH714_006161 [Hevea brasiliensis]|uniref:ApaG domain-containing protein n=1 Tax=Hevea brasiliensis TaxID=3981 RepID=A0A6A6N9U0_HEVBR|nr:hypothetical protein GH714_006161 [Hevea brasiliensis]
MGLEAVGDLALNEILSNWDQKKQPKWHVNKRFKASATEDSLWSKFCSRDLDLSAPVDPQGNPVPSFKFAYGLWREAFSMYPWPLVKRVKRCWDRLKNWLTVNFPEAGATLQQGASETQIQQLEAVLKVKLPLPARVLYRFCNGQVFQDKDAPKSAFGNTLGLIGGYTFYHHLVNVFLLPLDRVIMDTKQIMRQLEISGSFRRKFIVVAMSSTIQEKLFFLNCTNGQLYVGTRNLATDLEMMPCVPSGLLRSVHDFNSDQQGCCFEEPPLCSTAITNGVKVRASAVFVPEATDLEDSSEKYWFAYSIRMSLLPEGCFINGMYFGSCQLQRRHWFIYANGNIVSDVSGEAVIGKYPLLLPGERDFVYQSCKPLSTSSGSIEGSFTFVPGRLVDSKGAPFEVEVARFPLQLPDYIF